MASPQGRTDSLFCFGMREYLVDRGMDQLKEEKQDRPGTCRVSRVSSHQSEVGTVSTGLRDRSVPVGHRDDG